MIPLQHPKRDQAETLIAGIAQAHTAGIALDWEQVLPAGPGSDLPTYPFEHQRYWIAQQPAVNAAQHGMQPTGHPLLSATTQLPDGGRLLTGRISLNTHPWLADHTVHTTTLLPATAYLELALHAAHQAGCNRIEELTLHAPLPLTESGTTHLQVTLSPPDRDNRHAVTIRSTTTTDDAPRWTTHATGTITAEDIAPATAQTSWPPAGAAAIDTGDLYDTLGTYGYHYGPAFQALERAWKGERATYAETRLAPTHHTGRFHLHPALLDAALHPTLTPDQDPDTIQLPFSWNGVTLDVTGVDTLRVALIPTADGSVTLRLSDATGAHVGTVESLVTRSVRFDRLGTTLPAQSRPLYHLTWPRLPVSAAPEAPAGTWAVIGDAAGYMTGETVHPNLADLRDAIAAGSAAPAVVVASCRSGATPTRAPRPTP